MAYSCFVDIEPVMPYQDSVGTYDRGAGGRDRCSKGKSMFQQSSTGHDFYFSSLVAIITDNGFRLVPIRLGLARRGTGGGASLFIHIEGLCFDVFANSNSALLVET